MSFISRKLTSCGVNLVNQRAIIYQDSKKRNIQVGDALCPLCGSEEENTGHLFIACIVASNIWNGISAWCKIPNIYAFPLRIFSNCTHPSGRRRKRKWRFKVY
ncbi:putative reverse transcriptase zinc-binding domain-containing protein [Helianthus annuus]|nr:putative reverse transcriptase zinc-binding domain-containing protein [Helianthus annuus]